MSLFQLEVIGTAETYKVKTARLAIDFSVAKDSDYEALNDACRGHDIGVLGVPWFSFIEFDSVTNLLLSS